jgi:hypothetical protein
MAGRPIKAGHATSPVEKYRKVGRNPTNSAIRMRTAAVNLKD